MFMAYREETNRDIKILCICVAVYTFLQATVNVENCWRSFKSQTQIVVPCLKTVPVYLSLRGKKTKRRVRMGDDKKNEKETTLGTQRTSVIEVISLWGILRGNLIDDM